MSLFVAVDIVFVLMDRIKPDLNYLSGSIMSEGYINGKDYKFPHCNSAMLHAPGECYYCDHYPKRQHAWIDSGQPFTPNESNGWSGNVAVKAGEVHTHLLSTYVVGDGPTISQRNPDGTLSPVEPIGWREEHGWFARLVFWLRRIEHCNDREGQKK